jgi:hypothetical protein
LSGASSAARAIAWRRELAIVIVVAVGAAACWVTALIAAVDPVPPVVLVYAETGARAGETVPVRAVATRPERRRQLAFSGEIVAGGERASFAQGVAHVTVSNDAPCPPCAFALTGDAAGAPVSVTGALGAGGSAAARELRFVPWTAELQDRTVVDLAKPPIYPVDGSARSTLATRVLVLEGAAVSEHEVESNAALARAPDGRALVLDRSGVTLRVPPLVSPDSTFELEVHAAEAMQLHVDLFVDGRWRRAAVYEAAPGRSTLELTLPADARGWFAVHAPTSPLGSARGAQAVGLVRHDGVTEAELWPWTRTAGVLPKTDDPLLARAQAGDVAGATVTRALLSRLRVTDTERRRVSTSAEAQLDKARAARHAQADRWRLPFRVAGLLLAALLARLALLGARRVPHPELDLRGEEAGATETGRPFASLVWGSVAFVTSLLILWVLDWALGFVLLGLESS